MNLAKFSVYGVLTLFLTALILSTIFAYMRGYSGTTGLDMAKIQKMRTNTAQQIAEGNYQN